MAGLPPLPNFTLTQLHYFAATVEHGSFTGAATALGVSQPAVAEQIQRLERSCGQSLFARRSRGVALTAAGRLLEPHAREVLDAARRAVTEMTAADTPGLASVAVGTFGTPRHYGIDDLIRTFFERHPGGRLRIEGRNSFATAEAVRAGELDAAFVALPIDESGLDVTPIFDGEVFYASADPAHVARAVRIEVVVERPFIVYEASSGVGDPTRRQLAERAQAAGMRIEPRIEVESAETALELAADGFGDTYVPQVLVDTIDRRLGLASFDPPLVDTFALVARAGARLSYPVRALVDEISTHLAERARSVGRA